MKKKSCLNLRIESFYIQFVKSSIKKICIVLNNKVISIKNINCNISLRELRLDLKLENNYAFYFNDKEIKYGSEFNINVKDIITKDNNNIILKENEINANVIIDNVNSIYSIKCFISETLSNLRKKLNIRSMYEFFINNNFILPKQEGQFIVDDLIKRNSRKKYEIHLKIDNSLENNFSEKVNLIQGDYILKLDQKIYRIKLYHEYWIYEVRDKICSNDFTNFYFLNQKGEIINKEDEDKYTIKSISSKIKDIFKVTLKKENEPIENSKFLTMKNKLKIYKYPYIKLDETQYNKCKSLIVIGETGSGKTTLLNCLINYLMEIRKDDDFRYVIIDESDFEKENNSHTLNINSYFILPSKEDIPPIKIIDTPGFGDTRENFDLEVLKKFKYFLEKEKSIDLICFVMKSTVNRNTEFQKYIITNTLGLFGKDVISNFLILFTFCDGGEPLILNNLKSKESPFYKIISNIQEPSYISFNNSSIFSNEKKYINLFWDICYNGFSKLILKLKNNKKQSLNLSKKVMKIRDEILSKSENLNRFLDYCLEIQDQLDNEIKAFKERFIEMENNKDYISIVKKEKNEKIETDNGKHNINCLKCQQTCHKLCEEIKDDNILKCKLLKSSNCEICKCSYKEHCDLPYYLTKTLEDEEKINYARLDNFEDAQINIALIDSKIELNIKELKNYVNKSNDCVISIKNDFKNLNIISLLSNIYKTQENFVDYKINLEKSSKGIGYLKKIEIYEKYRKTFNRLNNIYNNNSILKDFDEFYKDFNIDRNLLIENVKDILIKTVICK
jgi:energy-coupling factor transporter ATP-binding protein EcfA2